MGRRAASLLAITAVACSEDVRTFPLDLSYDEGGAIVVVEASPEGDARTVELIATHGGPVRFTGTESDDTITIVFALSAGEIATADSRPLTADALDSLQVELTSEERRGCGRCLAPADRAPQLFHPGDSCPVPRFARAAAFNRSGTSVETPHEVFKRAREGIRIISEGPCACVPEPVELAARVDSCSLRPPHPSLGEDVWIDSQGSALFVGADHRQLVSIVDGGAPEVLELPSSIDRRIADHTITPITLSDGTTGFLVISTDNIDLVGASFETEASLVLTSSGAVELRSLQPTGLDAHGIQSSRQIGDQIYILSEERISSFSVLPKLVECTLDRASLRCEAAELGADCVEGWAEGPGAAADGPVAVGTNGMLVSQSGESWRCDPLSGPELEDSTIRFERVGRAGPRLIACADVSEPEGERMKVFDLSVSDHTLSEIHDEAGGHNCSITSLADGSGRIRLTNNVDLRVDPDGVVRVMEEPFNPPHYPREIRAAGVWQLAYSVDSAFRTDRAEGPWTEIYGPEAFEPQHRRALAPVGDEVWTFASPDWAIIVRGDDCESATTERIPLTGGNPRGGDEPWSAVADGAGRMHVFGVDDEGGYWRTLDLMTRRFVEERFFPHRLERAVYLAPLEEMVVMYDGAPAIAEEDGTLSPIPVIFDDPDTPIEEESEDAHWEEISAFGSVAWLNARGRLGRLVPCLDHQLCLEAYWWNRVQTRLDELEPQSGEAEPPNYLRAIEAVCPDVVRVTQERNIPDGSASSGVRREREAIQIGACEDSFAIGHCQLHPFLASVGSLPRAISPHGWFGPPEATVLYGYEGMLSRQSRRVRGRTGNIERGLRWGDALLFGGRFGRLGLAFVTP